LPSTCSFRTRRGTREGRNRRRKSTGVRKWCNNPWPSNTRHNNQCINSAPNSNPKGEIGRQATKTPRPHTFVQDTVTTLISPPIILSFFALRFAHLRYAKTPSPTPSSPPSQWRKYKTTDSNAYTYYFNELTGESSWDQPPDYVPPVSSSPSEVNHMEDKPSSPPKLSSSPPPTNLARPKTSIISATR